MTLSPLVVSITPGVTTGLSSDAVRKHKAHNCFYWAANYGVDSGNSDNTSAINDLLADVHAGNGEGTLSATIFWPGGVLRTDGQIVIPVDSGSPVPAIRSQRWIGTGAHSSGRGDASTPVQGTILDLRYSGGTGGPADAKIKSLGLGRLEIEHMTLADRGTSSNPFVYWTNTDLIAHDNAVWGNTTKSGVTCDQDAFVAGGTTANFDGSDTAAFQGYASRITDNYFGHIRRAYYARSDVNGIPFRGNTIWATCGSNLADDAPIVLEGISAKKVSGARIFDNLIEVSGGYVYAVKCDYCLNAVLGPNDIYDPSGSVAAAYRMTTNTRYCVVLDGYRDDSFPLVSDASSQRSCWLSSHAGVESQWQQPFRFRDKVFFDDPSRPGQGPRLVDASSNELLLRLSSAEYQVQYTPSGGSAVVQFGIKDCHILAKGTAPTIAASAAAGSGATASVSGKDLAGTLTITSGTGTSSGQIGVLTFNVAFGTTPRIQLTPSNAAAAACGVPYASSGGNGQFEISVPVAPATSTACTWYYQVTG